MITDAWVIHKYWSGDTSARVIFFTREHGLVNCLYKGGRTPKKQALLQSFTPLWLAVDVRGTAHFVRQLEVAAPPIQFAGQNLFAGLYINELLHHSLKLNDSHAALHAAYSHTLHALELAMDRFTIEALLRRFEWTLLTSCGYHMSLTHDAHTTHPIHPDRYYSFVAGEGFILADEGIRGVHILALSEDKLDDLDVLGVAKRIMRRAIDHALGGKEIKARALYRS
jgi:DNA repair protein RecO (recombination protein O)